MFGLPRLTDTKPTRNQRVTRHKLKRHLQRSKQISRRIGPSSLMQRLTDRNILRSTTLNKRVLRPLLRAQALLPRQRLHKLLRRVRANLHRLPHLLRTLQRLPRIKRPKQRNKHRPLKSHKLPQRQRRARRKLPLAMPRLLRLQPLNLHQQQRLRRRRRRLKLS